MRYDVAAHLAKLAKKYGKKFILNPAPAAPLDDETLDGVYCITPNETELGIIINRKIETMEEYANYGFSIMEDYLSKDKGYFFSRRSFLDIFLQLTTKDVTSIEDEDSIEEL
jgi:hypothetical protein